MAETVLETHRAEGRAELILALDRKTKLLADLYSRPLKLLQPQIVSDQVHSCLAGDMQPGPWFSQFLDSSGRQSLRSWVLHLHLDAPWMEAWLAYAAITFNVARRCRQPKGCVCDVIRSGRVTAVRTVASEAAFLSIGEPPAIEFINKVIESKMAENPRLASEPIEIFRAPHRRPAKWVVGPQPYREPKNEFLQRMEREFQATEALYREIDGVVQAAPRQLKRHAEWFVMKQVLGKTTNQILKTGGNANTVDTAVRTFARLVDVQLVDVALERRRYRKWVESKYGPIS